MKVALFGGSFDPVHSEHVRFVQAAKEALKLDKVIVLPAYISPFKKSGALVSGEERLEMCKIAFRECPYAEVSGFELSAESTSYTYLTCRHFSEKYPKAELFFLLGADALRTFPKWKNSGEILSRVTLCACGRGELRAEEAARSIGGKAVLIPHSGREVSSTRIRVELAFGREPEAVDKEVLRYIREKGLYSHPAILPALALEKEERREHSFRVALLAAECAPRFEIPQDQAILASALHDCGKCVPLDSPLLEGFTLPEGVPAPVVHQYTGAYLAEHVFGVADGEVLDAIRYHTSGRENMTALGKLVFLADLLEAGRSFEWIEPLREALRRDLDECLLLCLERQVAYLKSGGEAVYPLTQRAYEWITNKKLKHV